MKKKIFVFFFIVALANMKRNQVKFHDRLVLLLQEKKEAAEDRKILIDMVVELRKEIKIHLFQQKNPSVSVAKIFPVNSQQEIYNFLDNSDGLFQARCNGFNEYLFLVRAPTKKKFKENLKTLLFTDDYCERHHWPNIV